MHKGPFAYEENKTYVPICSLASLHGIFVRFIRTRLSILIIEQVHEISDNVVCATSKASDQPAHTRSLIRAFASRLSILRLLSY